jgi:16S rRNA processing protein RimM
MSNPSDSLLYVATLGKSVGLRGQMKLHIQSDFPEQIVSGAQFFLDKNRQVTIESFDGRLVKLQDINTPEDAKRFTNKKLYTTVAQTKEHCSLQQGEYFYFDLIGLNVVEGSCKLGTIEDIERIGAIDYLIINTDEALRAQKFSKSFLIPYQEHFIEKVDIADGTIHTVGALEILKAS